MGKSNERCSYAGLFLITLPAPSDILLPPVLGVQKFGIFITLSPLFFLLFFFPTLLLPYSLIFLF